MPATMSCGPAMVAIRLRPGRAGAAPPRPPRRRCPRRRTAPGTAAERAAAAHHRHAHPGQRAGQRVGAVHRGEHHPVDVPGQRRTARPGRGWPPSRPASAPAACRRPPAPGSTPRMMPGKNWSSEKTRLAASGSTSANESVRWVTRLRAAWLGTYPSSLDRPPDRLADRLGHGRRAVDHPGDGGPGDPGASRHRLQRRSSRGHRHPPSRSVIRQSVPRGSRPGTTGALSLSVRRWVS